MSAPPTGRPALGVGQTPVDLARLPPLPFEVAASRPSRDSFRRVLDAWPSLAALAAELRERYSTVHN